LSELPPAPGHDAADPHTDEPAVAPAATPAVTSTAPPGGHGLFRFSLEGRRAPALFGAGWLGTALGAGSAAIGLMAGGAVALVLIAVGLALLTVGLVLLGGSQSVERAAAERPWPGPSPVVVFAAAIAATLFAAILVGVPMGLLDVRLDRPVGDLFSVGLQALVFVGVVRVMVVGSGALTWRGMGFGGDRRASIEAAASGFLTAWPVVLLTAMLAMVLVPLFGATPPSPLPPTGTLSGTILHLLAGAVVAPVSEEILFRGVATTAWARTNGPTVAIVRSAVLFAFAHVLLLGGSDFGHAAPLVAVAALGRLPIAFALGWSYLRSGSIWAPIALHATFNAILIVVAELVGAGALG